MLIHSQYVATRNVKVHRSRPTDGSQPVHPARGEQLFGFFTEFVVQIGEQIAHAAIHAAPVYLPSASDDFQLSLAFRALHE